MKLLDLAFAELNRSNVDKRHPFRSMVLATHAEFPELRTVIKRNFDQKEGIIFYTDSRTPKCEQIQKNPNVSLLFYHPKKKLQLRIYGKAQLLSNSSETYKQALGQISNSASKNDYLTRMTPGSLLKSTKVTYGEQLYLSVIKVCIDAIDVVLLQSKGHKRSKYIRLVNGWTENKLVP